MLDQALKNVSNMSYSFTLSSCTTVRIMYHVYQLSLNGSIQPGSLLFYSIHLLSYNSVDRLNHFFADMIPHFCSTLEPAWRFRTTLCCLFPSLPAERTWQHLPLSPYPLLAAQASEHRAEFIKLTKGYLCKRKKNMELWTYLSFDGRVGLTESIP